MSKPLTYSLLLLFFAFMLQGQTNFRKAYEAASPIPLDSPLSFEEQLKIHQDYLDTAIATNDSLKQLYGYLFIFHDYLQIDDFAEANRYLLEAKSIADQAGNVGWKGWLTFRSGVIYIRTRKHEKAIETFEQAIPLCKAAGDSLCVGEAYEQLSAMNGVLNRYEEAKRYFELAMPLLEKYGQPKNICTALANRGSIVSIMGNPAEAIPIIERACNCAKEAKEYNAYAKGLNNLADAYRRLENYPKSIEVYQSAIAFNKTHDFHENRVTNLMGLHYVYTEQGDYETANDFLMKRYQLKDSVMGLSVQEKIVSLEAKYDTKQKELDLQKSENQLLIARNEITKMWTTFAILLLIVGFGIWYFYKKRQQLKLDLKQNEAHLIQLTQTLIRKNAGIKSLENELLKHTLATDEKSVAESEEENLFDQTILTIDDWTAFKINFEKTHPGYVLRLRKRYPDLSDAEERLFLLLKLNLTKNEIAAILGITPDTVKKTRSRLRKRLQLDQQDSLDEFVQTF